MSVAAAAQNLFEAWAYWTALGLVRPFAFPLFFAAVFWMDLGGGMLRVASALAVLFAALSPDTPQHAPAELALPYFAAVLTAFLIRAAPRRAAAGAGRASASLFRHGGEGALDRREPGFRPLRPLRGRGSCPRHRRPPARRRRRQPRAGRGPAERRRGACQARRALAVW